MIIHAVILVKANVQEVAKLHVPQMDVVIPVQVVAEDTVMPLAEIPAIMIVQEQVKDDRYGKRY